MTASIDTSGFQDLLRPVADGRRAEGSVTTVGVVPHPKAVVVGASRSEPTKNGEVAKAVARINEFIESSQRNLEFSVDEDTGRTVVTVINPESGEVVRRIPPEEVLAVAGKLDELGGVIFRGKA